MSHHDGVQKVHLDGGHAVEGRVRGPHAEVDVGRLPKHDTQGDRHSGTGTRGLPKKGGAGKGGWGVLGQDEDGPAYIDENDPNYPEGGDAKQGETTK